jgi:hypothetical protein
MIRYYKKHLIRINWITSFIFTFLLVGCGGMKPVTNGSQIDTPYAGERIVVWGSHSGAVGEVVTELQKSKFRIVERSRLKQVFDEQKIILSDTSDDEAQILKVGKIVGAETIVFVDVQNSSNVVSSASAYKYVATSQSGTAYHISVSVRGVSVETGDVLWTGSAHYPRAINNPEAGIIYLTRSALGRGLCPPSGWNDKTACNDAKFFGTGRLGFHILHKKSSTGPQIAVVAVMTGSPAERAGVKVGDILISCDGKSVGTSSTEYMTNCKANAGQTIKFELKRGENIVSVSATAIPRTVP